MSTTWTSFRVASTCVSAKKGEQLKLLNEQTVELDDTVLAITDASGAIGLAGIMGGDSTKAELSTTSVFLESAFFYPQAIQGRARKYNFVSDASHRFERGVDFNNNVDGIERATRLILDICGGQAGPTVDTVAKLPVREPVTMRVARCVKIIGKPISRRRDGRNLHAPGVRAKSVPPSHLPLFLPPTASTSRSRKT